MKPAPGVDIAVFYVFAILSHLIRNCQGSITLSCSIIILCVIICAHDDNGQCDTSESDENQKSDDYCYVNATLRCTVNSNGLRSPGPMQYSYL